ncbi:hypothetical protein K440DRAFT_659813 [Wilcoxina mikolae CBS 423.85]|nr:hypothetical protein K440DRAFT_659813 [Wilcoxina mikolae CBS 423.85]
MFNVSKEDGIVTRVLPCELATTDRIGITAQPFFLQTGGLTRPSIIDDDEKLVKRSYIFVPTTSFYATVILCLILSIVLVVIATCFVLQHRRRRWKHHHQPSTSYHHNHPPPSNDIERGEGGEVVGQPQLSQFLEVYTDTPRPDSTTLPTKTQPPNISAPPFPSSDQHLSVIHLPPPPPPPDVNETDNTWLWSLSWRGQVQSYLVSPSASSELGSPVSPTWRNSGVGGGALRELVVRPPKPPSRSRSDSALRRLDRASTTPGKRRVRTMEMEGLWPPAAGGIARQVSISKGEKPALVRQTSSSRRKVRGDMEPPLSPPKSFFAWARGSGLRDDSSVDEDYR